MTGAEFAALIVAVEASTEILTDSEVTRPARERVAKVNDWLGQLVNCGYCTSVWVAGAAAMVHQIQVSDHPWVNVLVTLLLLHRSSNLFHEVVNRMSKKIPFLFSIQNLASAIFARRPVSVSHGAGVPEGSD